MGDFEPTTRRTSPVLWPAFVLYGLSMFLPAWRDNDELVLGYQAAKLTLSFGLGSLAGLIEMDPAAGTARGSFADTIPELAGFQANAGMIVGCFFSFFKGRIPKWIAMLQFGIAFLMAILLAILPAPTLFFRPMYEKFESGYYLWTCSFALASWVSWLRLRLVIWPNETDAVS